MHSSSGSHPKTYSRHPEGEARRISFVGILRPCGAQNDTQEGFGIGALFLFVLVSILTAGCGTPPSKQPLASSEAHQKLVTILREENDLTVVTREFDNTLWVYVPLEENFFEIKAKPQPAPPASSEPSNPQIIHFLDGAFNGQDFILRYDISSSKQYAKDYGYTSTFTQEYQTKQRSILTAVYRAYGDTKEAPEFLVVVMADIVNGLEARTLLYFEDLKRAYVDQTFYEEYAKRTVSDQPIGDPVIIGDAAGAHVNFREITMPEFLAKQIVFRINFKYTQSAFPPTEPPREEILNIAAETIGAYGFEEFGGVKLKDLESGLTETVAREELGRYAPEASPSQGRLIHIKFQ